MRKFIKPLLAFATVICISSSSIALALKSDLLQINFQNQKNNFTINLNKQRSFKGKFTVFNGKSGKYEKLNAQYNENDRDGKKEFQIRLSNRNFIWTMSCVPRGKIIILRGDIKNTGSSEIFLEPSISVFCPRTGKDYFWGGFNMVPVKNKILERSGLKGKTAKHLGGSFNLPFPVSAFIGKKNAIFIGHPFLDPVSYSSSKLKPSNEKSGELSFSQRIAVGAGHTVRVNFLVGAAPARYGKEECVVQALYDAIPESWSPNVGQDNPYIWGAHSHYRSWNSPNYELERYFHSKLTWAYCPYKRSGDIYGDEKLWNYQPERDIKISFANKVAGEVFDYNKLTCGKFHKLRQKLFKKYARDFGWAFYTSVAGTWCEINLARQHYQDAINKDTGDGSKILKMIIDVWSTTHDKEIRVFPMGTSFGRKIREDMRKVYQELDMPGFAFDCAIPGAYYRGPAVNNPELPGRAWDDKGIFIDQSVAINSLSDFVHDLKKNDKLFVWANGCLKADYIMLETSIFNPVFYSWMPLYRYNIGQRPAGTHGHGFLINSTIPNWRTLNKKDFLDKLGKLASHVVLTDFQYGITEDHTTQFGNPQSIYCMPELIELMRTGWQAQLPVDCNSEKYFYKARYGRAENTIIYFGNPWPEKIKLKFETNNSYLGKAKYLFVRKMRNSATLINTVKNGITSFSDTLPSRVPALFEAVCGLSHTPEKLQCTVRSRKDKNKITFHLKLSGNPKFKTTIMPREIRDFDTPLIRINGKLLKSSDCNIPENAEITLEYRSLYFGVTAAEILNFPFENAKKDITFTIFIPQNANKAEIKEAERLVEYFKFREQRHSLKGKVDIKISGQPAPAPNSIVFRVGRKYSEQYPSGIHLKNNVLSICSQNPLEAEKISKMLKYVMDRRFEYIIPFARINGMSKEIIDRFKLNNRYLPFARCFESNIGTGGKYYND